MSVDQLRRLGFPVAGEPLVALDLADTLKTAVDPHVDLLASPEQAAAWWRVELARLPESPVPDPAAARRLRAAVRDLLDAHLEHRAPRATSVEDVNAAAAAVPTSVRLTQDGRAETRWHTEFGGNAALAAIARETIELLASPDRLGRLRRCANPTCSMVFLAETARRQWCSSAVCGNRMRVARHYQRTRAARTGGDA
ncbi:MAG TPA: ABATE domain-containing protein [Pseudonocardiaceae bacterium]|jgi:predicted RNA-binding Zn ribbon-like protein|nr:ABATE domain-containing protein [Pseudonocardiaceae bacterium]